MQMDNMSAPAPAPSARERAQRLYEKVSLSVFFFPFFPSYFRHIYNMIMN